MIVREASQHRVLVLGGDGFCGWPTCLHLSRLGYDVIIVDDLSRRTIDAEYGTSSLTPIRSPTERLEAWYERTGRKIEFLKLRAGESSEEMIALLKTLQPRTIVHFAEQRSAPFSMKSWRERRYTMERNLSATHDLLIAAAQLHSPPHIVHLGSIGVYGYKTRSFMLPEGYLTVTAHVNGVDEKMEILYPADPESIYHLSKANDQLLFQYYSKNDRLPITDLHQGIVWGTQTDETELDERLINRFDYDGDYGTVLNRFLLQASLGYPLTVHGTGRQTRAFIHIRDTIRCLAIAINNPPRRGEGVRIYNQVTETHRILDLARLISELSGTPYRFVDNPRLEAEENDLAVRNDQLLGLGLEPTRLRTGLLEEVRDIAQRYSHRCDEAKIPSTSKWRATPPAPQQTTDAPSTRHSRREPVPDELHAHSPKEAGHDPGVAAP